MCPELAPKVGAFVRPVGIGYGYCLRVVKVFPPDEHDARTVIKFERWGLKDGAPVRDGYQKHIWQSDLVPALPGVWRDEWPHQTPRWTCCPLYYRLMDTGPNGQMELI